MAREYSACSGRQTLQGESRSSSAMSNQHFRILAAVTNGSWRPLDLPFSAATLSKLPLVCTNQLLPFCSYATTKSSWAGIHLTTLHHPLSGTHSARTVQENCMEVLMCYRTYVNR